MSDAYLALETGDVVEATARAPGMARGELVFTTAYTGYEESLTDPSYEAQVLTFAYPLIGNYGVRPERTESDRVHPSAVVARELTDDVADWLRTEGVPAVDGIDTRDLVLDIRDGGAMQVGIAAGPDASPATARAQLADCPRLSARTEIGAHVSVDTAETHGNGDTTVALVDCGAKRSIIDAFVARGATVHRLPYDATPADIAAVDPDLLFISNGPGDPANFDAAEHLVDEYIGTVPIAGICLGQQIVARALGGDTEKMDFGHRGVNQPVLDHDSGRVVMTTQNHGYTVADPGDLTVTQVNVNDGTPEALDSAPLDVLTRQYHPEANPGPHDTRGFFDDVLAMADASYTPATAD
ncbi:MULTISPECIES: glutamine-hydrolyzing carbamoyl-phosphate synthase small subunit [Halobacterium]|uniref:Carbamoyl phosphate synthase small chain n=6 Tax=Halobacterium salinarum TaxID=2242 RepID=CARA_HALSA|nr:MULTISPECIES: glutamine-hydrolyzing carbamoyl-phosphate synthase small subunit [Halobacterium]B0R6F1.1 RecName: Full=Carbamoyl phosphate synthase small chain; AltName: Full=Carbamoyl phosphate synthetase glutamine chain [Halobacterium salinarum R1]Q9HP42.1 RecName: Full=Carbamoyl phosphate synthase small chain; AltName: Full=Carbamoyl phosphate synthetase glutamine chain [Halobacterium salinarum NRC-1]AAG20028.1 carbamoyl-phosphate synthase small subunit [Halobacterium salinarum NRC-1]MBB608